MVLRFKFKKYSSIVYLGHLDVMRYFQKAIRRSGIDAAYTEGFSPHLKLSFAQPLSVGVETDGDYFDLEVNTLPDMNTIVQLFKDNCVEGFDIVSVTLLDEGTDNAMSSVKAADYELTFENDYDKDMLEKFFSQDSYVFEYYKKDVLKSKDIMPFIYNHEYVDDKRIVVRVDCSSMNNLKVSTLTGAMEKFGIDNKVTYYKRLDLFTGKDGNYISLGELGKVYD